MVVALGAIFVVRRRNKRRDLPGMVLADTSIAPTRMDPVDRAVSAGPLQDSRRSGALPLRLTVVRGARQGEDFQATLKPGTAIVVGSESGSHVQLAGDPDVAPRHCALQLSDNILTIVEVEAGFRTTRNGVPIRSRAKLDDGDIIGVGSTELRVRRAAV